MTTGSRNGSIGPSLEKVSGELSGEKQTVRMEKAGGGNADLREPGERPSGQVVDQLEFRNAFGYFYYHYVFVFCFFFNFPQGTTENLMR